MALGDKLPVVMGKEKAVANGVATLDSDGKLAESQRPTTDPAPTQDSDNPVQSGGVYTALAGKADLTLSNLSNRQRALWNIGGRPNRNLLDNWYFVGGGSQQGGGQFPINQRGETSYTSLNQQIYTVDRWFSTASGSFSVTSQGLSLVGNCALFQRLEPSRIPDDAHITFSVLWDDGELTVCSGTKYEQGTKAESDRTISFGYDSVTYSGIIWVYIASTTTSTKTIVAAKLELGSHQTLARQDADGNWVLLDPPPNFQQELAKCQRYLLILSGFGWIGSGVVDDTSTGQFFLPTPVSMRITPTMAGLFRIYNNINNFQVTTATASGHTENGINGMITFTGGTFQVGDAFCCWLNTNEKLMLSAEL